MITRRKFTKLVGRVLEMELWRKIHVCNDDNLIGRDIQRRMDIELLCDYLGLEFVDTAAKRAVVKKK